jgi:anti-sigma B factor antagonist
MRDGSLGHQSQSSGEAFRLKTARDDDVVRLGISGELDLSRAEQLEGAIRAEASDAREIVIDLTDLQFMDSSGLQVLLQAYGRSREDSDRISFVPSKHEAITRLLVITETTEIFGPD